MLVIAVLYHKKKITITSINTLITLIISTELSSSKTVKIKADCLSYVADATEDKITAHLLQKDMVRSLIMLLTVPSETPLTTTCYL